MLQKTCPYYLADKAVYANEDLKVFDKYSGEVAASGVRVFALRWRICPKFATW
jgi:hypothetical protein